MENLGNPRKSLLRIPELLKSGSFEKIIQKKDFCNTISHPINGMIKNVDFFNYSEKKLKFLFFFDFKNLSKSYLFILFGLFFQKSLISLVWRMQGRSIMDKNNSPQGSWCFLKNGEQPSGSVNPRCPIKYRFFNIWRIWVQSDRRHYTWCQIVDHVLYQIQWRSFVVSTFVQNMAAFKMISLKFRPWPAF